MRRIFILLMFLLGSVTACAPTISPSPDRPPQEGVTPTPLPTPEAWVRTVAPIQISNIANVRQTGVLPVPEPPSTVFAYALALDNTRLYGLNNDNLLGWDLLTGELLFNVPREDAIQVYVSPDRQRIYTLTVGALIRVYTSDTGTAVENFRALDTFQSVVAYDPLGGFLALGGTDGVVQLWDVPNRASLGVLRGTSAAITALVMSPDGQTLLAADAEGNLTAWDFATLQLQSTGSTGQVVNRLLYPANQQAILADTPNGTLVIHPIDLNVVGGLSENPSSGLFAMVGQTNILMHGSASAVTLWDVSAGRQVASLSDTATERVTAAASADGTLLMTAVLDTGISLWNISDVAAGTVLRGALRLEDRTLRDIIWTPDGYQILLFTTRGPIRVLGLSQ